jgi:hypothetical protein
MFLGVGIGKALALLIFIMLGIVVVKTILNKYPVNGLTEIVNAV